MKRQYAERLVTEIQEKQRLEVLDDVEVTVKPIPDCDITGAMDPRLYKEMRPIGLALRFVPKVLMKRKLTPKSLKTLRKMFNSVDSYPMVETKISQSQHLIKSFDGFEIPIYSFKSQQPLADAPILYFIHGGGFFAGSTEVITEALKLFVAKTNMLAFAIDYRLAPEHPYPCGHEDCFSGLKWIAEHASQFGGDPQKIFVAGDSAGGNLTQYCTNRSLELELALVKGQLLLYPTVNMGGIVDEHVVFSKEKYNIYSKHANAINVSLDMLGGATENLAEILGTPEVLTPYLAVNPQLPPTFVTVGEHDFLKVETLAYARKLRQAGVTTETVLYLGMGHAYIDKIGYFPQAEDCVLEMINFIRKYQ